MIILGLLSQNIQSITPSPPLNLKDDWDKFVARCLLDDYSCS